MDNLQAIESRYFFRRVFNIMNSIERRMIILVLFAFFITPADTHAQDEHQTIIREELAQPFRPEFLNRIDSTVVFHGLGQDHILEIVDLLILQVEQHLQEKNIAIEDTQAAKELWAEKGYAPDFGARPLRRLIQNVVEDKLSEELLTGRLNGGDTALVDVEDGEIVAKAKIAVPSHSQ